MLGLIGTTTVAGAAFLLVRGGVDPDESFVLRADVPASSEGFALALRQSLGVELRPGHRLELLDNGRVFDALVKELNGAQSSMHLLLYIWERGAASDRVVSALIARARAGVACRILVDSFGSPKFGEEVEKPLVAAGCEVRIFRPSPSDKLARNHRKIVVVDGRVGFTGGFGIRDDWLGDGVHDERWRDTNVLFAGPAVQSAQQAFAENWQEAGGQLLPIEAFPEPLPVSESGTRGASDGTALAAFVSSSASPSVTRAERLTQLLISSARKRLWIANAYFVPSRAILDLLARKASEGVDVRILVPGKKSDSKTSFGVQQFEYGSLLDRGVRVWEYQPSMMHSKSMVIDQNRGVIGSVNLEPLSLRKLEEGALVFESPALARALTLAFEQDCSRAQELKR
ncbi:MAG TPA: phosphatidylserine/phosphatidylglycerophosphate/cardiolipin synthase family protein [Polyangiaceae bacterium]|nr:phosphatidylserine/phosphatidylglycerophosphate/cardiolipin synthase family protein [Polyangiaceae bacterium]